MTVWYYIINEEGVIEKFGHCSVEDIDLQLGNAHRYFAFEDNPMITDTTHIYDFAQRKFVVVAAQ